MIATLPPRRDADETGCPKNTGQLKTKQTASGDEKCFGDRRPNRHAVHIPACCSFTKNKSTLKLSSPERRREGRMVCKRRESSRSGEGKTERGNGRAFRRRDKKSSGGRRCPTSTAARQHYSITSRRNMPPRWRCESAQETPTPFLPPGR